MNQEDIIPTPASELPVGNPPLGKWRRAAEVLANVRSEIANEERFLASRGHETSDRLDSLLKKSETLEADVAEFKYQADCIRAGFQKMKEEEVEAVRSGVWVSATKRVKKALADASMRQPEGEDEDQGEGEGIPNE